MHSAPVDRNEFCEGARLNEDATLSGVELN